jgi:hypothetical protein
LPEMSAWSLIKMLKAQVKKTATTRVIKRRVNLKFRMRTRMPKRESFASSDFCN